MANIPVILLAFANDKVDYARYLRNLPIEHNGIRDALFKAQQAGLCEVVERANATIEGILDVFQSAAYKDRIAIFHYGGHADGYQLILEQADGSHAVAHGGGLVSFFAKQKSLKLVFFNGCSTQQQAEELVKSGIPAVIGTSNSINDDVATTLAIRFYKSLANGAGIEKAWAEGLDQLKIMHGTNNMKALHRVNKKEKEPDQFPWNMYFKEGSEIVKEWNLPEAVDNPLFGLPEIPKTYNLPETPYLFLRRYERPQAEIFFGRSYNIRDLYKRIDDKNSAPVILLYGQSGVGKSSLLDAGLLPRLEESHLVRYVRRNKSLGMLGTLLALLTTVDSDKKDEKMVKNKEIDQNIAPENKEIDQNTESENKEELEITEEEKKSQEQIEKLSLLAEQSDLEIRNEINELIKKIQQKTASQTQAKKEDSEIKIENAEEVSYEFRTGLVKDLWHKIERKYGKPLIVILDQVEETFVQINEDLPNEFEAFLEELKLIFGDPQALPMGKMILSYRKEYHPEIEEFFKLFEIPREKVFLKHLGKKDILDVVRGLTSNERLKKAYRLEMENSLPVVIADDLLEDRESSIAPVLQILLTKLWQQVEKEEKPKFTVEKYQKLRKEGLLLNDFFYQQMKKVREWNSEVVDSGLALDILFFHTTLVGAMNTRTFQQLQDKYTKYVSYDPNKKGFYRKEYLKRIELLPKLVAKFKELYLFTDAPNKGTGLAHDTIAPLIIKEFQESELSGQRAKRILSSKIIDYLDHRTDADLEVGLLTRIKDRILGKKKVRFLLDAQSLDLVEKGLGGMSVITPEEDELMAKSREERNQMKQFVRFMQATAVVVVLVIMSLAYYARIEAREAAEAGEKAKKASKEAIIAKDSAVVSGQRAIIAMNAADSSKNIATEQSKIAYERTEEAIKSANIAELKTEEARKSADTAKLKTKEAEKSQAAATVSGVEAQMKSIIADFSKEDANFGQAKAKAKELAVKSIAITENAKKEEKTLLALFAYKINEQAYKNLKTKVEETNTTYKNKALKDYKNLTSSDSKSEISKNVGEIKKKYSELETKSNNQLVPSEIFEALRDAYLLNDRNKMKDGVVREQVESWDIQMSDKQSIFINNDKGGAMIVELVETEEDLPVIKLSGDIANNFKCSFLISAGDKIFGGSKTGEVAYWNSQAPARNQNTIAKLHNNILSLAYSKLTKEIIYSVGGNIYLQKQKDRTDEKFLVKREIKLENSMSNIRALQVVEDKKNCYLIAGNEKGNLYKIDLQADTLQAKPIIYEYKGKNKNSSKMEGGFYCVAYNPQEQLIAFGSGKGDILMFILSPSELFLNSIINNPQVINHPLEGIIKDITFSADGTMLAAAHWAGEIRLWKLPQQGNTAGFPILHFRNKRKVFAIEFGFEDKYLFFSGEEKVRACPTDPKTFYLKLCQQEQKKKSNDEWKKFKSSSEYEKGAEIDCSICDE
ncbi:MAG: hypothetical protein EAZ97_09030 [Bacteroidetes bacterium]|nr:MAG: hypothetical protein EAZ97_09030 [Bacteroidota bacterium]